MYNQKKEETQDKGLPNGGTKLPEFTIDFAEFAHFFEGEDMTEDEARELLQRYYLIALEIMSLGFGFHPVQQAEEACGKQFETRGFQPFPASDEVYLTQEQLTEHFELLADRELDQAEKDSSHDAI